MNLDIVPTKIKFSYDTSALNMLLRKVEATIKDNPSVCAAVLSAASVQGDKIDKATLLPCLELGHPPAVTPMHQMYLAPGRDPDWVMRLTAESSPRIAVLAELLLAWQKKQGNVFLTRQLTSIIAMGLVNYLLDSKANLPDFSRDILFGSGGIPLHLKQFAAAAFGPLGWSPVQYCPARENFEAAGYRLPVPNPDATHAP